MVHVTSHAVSRFRERVAPVSYDDAVAALSSPAVEMAAAFGAPFVKLGTGQRIVLAGHCVVTVLQRDKWPTSLSPYRAGMPHNGNYA